MIPIFYINLDRVPERRAFMEAQFEVQGLEAQRVPAIDAFDQTQPSEYSPGMWLDRWSLTSSEVACFESHRLAWRSIRDGNAPYGVILEDDAILSSEFAKRLALLSDAVLIADVIKLDGINQIRRFGPLTSIAGILLRPIKQTLGSSAAYMISRESAAKLETRAIRYCDHLDDYIFTPSRNWVPLQLDPAIAVQGMFIQDEVSTRAGTVGVSERTSDTRINANHGRGPRLYRLSKELRRVGRKLRFEMWEDRNLLTEGGLIDRPPLAADLGRYR